MTRHKSGTGTNQLVNCQAIYIKAEGSTKDKVEATRNTVTAVIEYFTRDYPDRELDYDITVDFYENYVAAITGWNCWKTSKVKSKFQNYCTSSDEALTIVLLENNLDSWLDEFANVVPKSKPKYTIPSGKTAVKYGGWNEAGRRRYKELNQLVKQRRETASWKSFVQKYQRQCYQEHLEKKRGMKKVAPPPQNQAEKQRQMDLVVDDLDELTEPSSSLHEMDFSNINFANTASLQAQADRAAKCANFDMDEVSQTKAI